MKQEKIYIKGIPSIIFGKESDKLYIHVHGKQSKKEYAQSFAEIAETKGYKTLAFDLPEHGERKDEDYRCDVFNGMKDLKIIYDYASEHYKELSLYACSLGAYFSLQTYSSLGIYKNLAFKNVLFQSPIVDMKYLIEKMFEWNGIDEKMLKEKKEIVTPLDTLRWDYYQYVLKHPIQKWNFKTSVLYGAKDNLQSKNVIETFCDMFNCKLQISENSEHPFMSKSDLPIVQNWLESDI